LLCGALIGLLQFSVRREVEILILRVLRRKSPKRPALNNADRLLFVWLSRLVPTTLAALTVVPVENSMQLANGGESDDAVARWVNAQTALWCAHWAVPVQRTA
jgi:hypothetical protein